MTMPTLLEQFITVSQILTGQKDLVSKKEIAAQNLNRLQLQYPKEMQDFFLEVSKFIEKQKDYLEFEVKRRLVETDKYFPISSKIMKIWYTGQFTPLKIKNIELDKLPMTDEKLDASLRTKEQYDEALIWKEAHTHPPGDGRKRKYGHWSTSPEKNHK
jgi:hypothetical protein